MKLLILGGTVFLGRHIVEIALERGHQVTLFNRGQHVADLFPGLEKLRGDRDGNLDPLLGRDWDAVIDTSGYVPRVVRASAQLLSDHVSHYTFISSISVFSEFSQAGMDETSPVGTLADPTVEDVTGGSYGPLKALCEGVVEEELPGRALSIRPGLIVGPWDPTDRFTYWPHRIADGGEVLAPRPLEGAIQFVDVRDLAEWTVRMAEGNCVGILNATGPDYPLTMGAFLDTCCRVITGADDTGRARLVWVAEEFLTESGAEPWSEVPLWVPGTAEYAGFAAIDCRKAIAAGLRFRPLEETVQDTLAWDSTRARDREWRAGLSREKERELLAQWRARSSPDDRSG